jgi:hypothetical protein
VPVPPLIFINSRECDEGDPDALKSDEAKELSLQSIHNQTVNVVVDGSNRGENWEDEIELENVWRTRRCLEYFDRVR